MTTTCTLAHLAALVSVLSFMGGCTNDPPSTFENPPAPDNGPGVDPGTFPPSTGDITNNDPGGTGAVCKLKELPSFTPTWRAPHAAQKTACSKADIAAYSDACLALPHDKARCDTYTREHAVCATCLQTQATDANQGVIQWRARNAYTINVAGCIALTQNDTSTKGCGAAYDAAIECRRQSCDACLAGDQPATFESYSACQKEAGKTTVCDTLARTQKGTCGDLTSSGKPTAVCFASSGSAAFQQIATVFCGGT